MEEESQAQKFPMTDINPDKKMAVYISVLERRLAQQEILMTQYRALIEALTGDTWEKVDTRLSKTTLKKAAANAAERNMARDIAAAEKAVDENLEKANEQA